MKNLNSKIIYLSMLATLLVFSNACRKIIPVDIDQKDKKIVLNATVSPEGVEARASLSLGLNDRTESITYLNNAILTLYKNDEAINVFSIDSNDENGHYIVPNFLPETGVDYTIRVENEPQVSVSASSFIPDSIFIDTISYKKDTYAEFDYSYNVYSFYLEIDDPADEENYYMISASGNVSYTYYDYDLQKDTVFTQYQSFWLETKDPSFDANSYGEHLYFTDELFNGQTHSTVVGIDEYALYGDTILVDFKLSSITKEYYLFLKTKEKQLEMDDFSRLLGATPVQVYNNVEGGYGYFGGYSYTTKQIELIGLGYNDYYYYKKSN